MSASDPRTDSCMERRAGDYCHRHVSFLLTLALFTGTDYPTFETTVASQFVLDFLHEIRFLHKCKNLTLGPRKIKTTFWKARDFPQCCQVGDATSEVNPLHFCSVIFPLRLRSGTFLGKDFCLPDNRWAATGFPTKAIRASGRVVYFICLFVCVFDSDSTMWHCVLYVFILVMTNQRNHVPHKSSLYKFTIS